VQKSERNPVGFTKEAIRSCPAIQRKFRFSTMTPAFDDEPPCLRQSEQWH
jgi:hypothetical protein